MDDVITLEEIRDEKLSSGNDKLVGVVVVFLWTIYVNVATKSFQVWDSNFLLTFKDSILYKHR